MSINNNIIRRKNRMGGIDILIPIYIHAHTCNKNIKRFIMVFSDVFYTDPIIGRRAIILEQCNTTRCTVTQYFINTIESVIERSAINCKTR